MRAIVRLGLLVLLLLLLLLLLLPGPDAFEFVEQPHLAQQRCSLLFIYKTFVVVVVVSDKTMVFTNNTAELGSTASNKQVIHNHRRSSCPTLTAPTRASVCACTVPSSNSNVSRAKAWLRNEACSAKRKRDDADPLQT